MRKRSAGLLAAALGMAMVAAPLAPVGAGVGDTVLNPGTTTITFQALSINIAGQELGLPKPTDPPQCSNGTNDDIALDDPENPALAQDLLIDFAGGDPECSDPLDNSEVMPGFQPKENIVITGDVDANGIVELTTSSFPVLYVWVFAGAGFPLRLDFSADVSGVDEGTVDPATGAVDVDLPLQLIVYTDQGGGLEPPDGFATCDTGVFPVAPSSNPASPVNQGGVRPVSNFPYNTVDGRVGVSDNTFVIPALAAAFPDPGIEFFCNELNTSFGLPSAANNNATSIELEVIEDGSGGAFFSGDDPSTTSSISGNVSDGGTPLQGLYVNIYSSTSTGSLGTTLTDASGNYSFAGVPAGRYKVRVFDLTNTYPSKWWQSAPLYAAGSEVTAPQGGAAIDVDFNLGTTGSISGNVSDGVNPLEGVQVRLYTPNGYAGVRAFTDASGNYTLPNLAPRTDYAVRFYTAGVYSEWWDDAPTYKSPGRLDVDVPASGIITDVDAVL